MEAAATGGAGVASTETEGAGSASGTERSIGRRSVDVRLMKWRCTQPTRLPSCGSLDSTCTQSRSVDSTTSLVPTAATRSGVGVSWAAA